MERNQGKIFSTADQIAIRPSVSMPLISASQIILDLRIPKRKIAAKI